MSTRNRIHNVLCYPLVHPLIVWYRIDFYNENTTLIKGGIPGTTRTEIIEALDPSGRLYRRFQYCAYWQYLSTLQSNTSSKDGDSLTHQMGLSRASFFRYFTQLHGTLNARSEKQGCTYVDTILSNFRYNSTATRTRAV